MSIDKEQYEAIGQMHSIKAHKLGKQSERNRILKLIEEIAPVYTLSDYEQTTESCMVSAFIEELKTQIEAGE